LQNTLSVVDNVIPSDHPQLAVSVNVNDGIDVQMRSQFVAQQKSFWINAKASRQRVSVTERTKRDEVMRALADARTDDQIVYFYCHAESTMLKDVGGPDASCLVLTDERITLGDLNLDAPTTIPLPGNPLVFINACESAEMSPAFYDGFVPYFMAKGARGVIGTECRTPALFAQAWAKRFFERFLDGEPLGATFLGLRREFLDEKGNPLGLLYAMHCDGDTQIQPALVSIG
ncbi:MAG: CHAT domain-containing protein, partial [Bradyrhizobium sp.]